MNWYSWSIMILEVLSDYIEYFLSITISLVAIRVLYNSFPGTIREMYYVHIKVVHVMSVSHDTSPTHWKN